jgi:hypothetical protein
VKVSQEVVEAFERAMAFRHPANVRSFIRVACQVPLKCRSTPELAITSRVRAFELPLGYAIKICDINCSSQDRLRVTKCASQGHPRHQVCLAGISALPNVPRSDICEIKCSLGANEPCVVKMSSLAANEPCVEKMSSLAANEPCVVKCPPSQPMSPAL